jgi:hypothetical protein
MTCVRCRDIHRGQLNGNSNKKCLCNCHDKESHNSLGHSRISSSIGYTSKPITKSIPSIPITQSKTSNDLVMNQDDERIREILNRYSKLSEYISKMKNDAEQMDFTTTPCDWTEKDAEIIADYEITNELGLKNVKTLDIKQELFNHEKKEWTDKHKELLKKIRQNKPHMIGVDVAANIYQRIKQIEDDLSKLREAYNKGDEKE